MVMRVNFHCQLNLDRLRHLSVFWERFNRVRTDWIICGQRHPWGPERASGTPAFTARCYWSAQMWAVIRSTGTIANTVTTTAIPVFLGPWAKSPSVTEIRKVTDRACLSECERFSIALLALTVWWRSQQQLIISLWTYINSTKSLKVRWLTLVWLQISSLGLLKINTLIHFLYTCEGMYVSTCICIIMARGQRSGQLVGAGSLFKPR